MPDDSETALTELIAGLRVRAADPARRADAPTSQFEARIQGLSLGALFGEGRSVAGDLMRVVRANQAGVPLDPALVARADAFEAEMRSPSQPDLAEPAGEPALDRAEADLGFPLPRALRRIYAEVADGGFGPGAGLFPIAGVVDTYLELVSEPPGPRGQAWPAGLLPVLESHPGYTCVEAATGRVIDWNPEDLTERSGDRAWQRSFSELAGSIPEWLGDWLRQPTPQELAEAAREQWAVEHARRSREILAAMSPEERRKLGLSDEGWEEVAWGGIGLEPDEPSPAG